MDKQLWAALEDVHLHSRLINIARRHLKLALEFGERTTLPIRKEAIKAEVQRLRKERNALIESAVRPASDQK